MACPHARGEYSDDYRHGLEPSAKASSTLRAQVERLPRLRPMKWGDEPIRMYEMKDGAYVRRSDVLALLTRETPEEPPKTCATCKWDSYYAECLKNWRRPLVGMEWKKANGCTLHAPRETPPEDR